MTVIIDELVYFTESEDRTPVFGVSFNQVDMFILGEFCHNECANIFITVYFYLCFILLLDGIVRTSFKNVDDSFGWVFIIN